MYAKKALLNLLDYCLWVGLGTLHLCPQKEHERKTR